MSENITFAQGPAKPADMEDLIKDAQGITNPNLHRRIGRNKAEQEPDEIEKDNYELGVYGVDSYRTTEHIVHDDDSTTSEVP